MEKLVRINVDIDDALMEKALRMSGIKTKKELVNTALRYYRDRLLREKAEEEKPKKRKNEDEH
jgi:Arc/MetJ family transcription regulator